jgi:hypothetical protein
VNPSFPCEDEEGLLMHINFKEVKLKASQVQTQHKSLLQLNHDSDGKM